jgi:spectinomycin phosphotransferase
VQDLPPGFDESELCPALAEGWGIAVDSVEYAAVGFGSYHWIATGQDQRRLFVTVDDLDHKRWLGDTCDRAFAGLRTAFDLALALRDRGGLDFVVAPLPATGGETVRRVGRCHTVALFPFIDGASGGFGDITSPQQRGDVVRMLARLHQTAPAALTVTQPASLDFAGRRGLEAALNNGDRTWHGGLYAEPTRAWLADHAEDLARMVDDFDQLAVAVAATAGPPVITHGEPHPGNVMRSHDGLVLIDWDTVRLAPPERDLWLVATASGEEVATYADATGHEVNAEAMSLYRLAWDLADIASYIDLFRSPHSETEDTGAAWLNLQSTVRRDER